MYSIRVVEGAKAPACFLPQLDPNFCGAEAPQLLLGLTCFVNGQQSLDAACVLCAHAQHATSAGDWAHDAAHGHPDHSAYSPHQSPA